MCRYSRPVFLEPHMLKLRPRCDGMQNLTQFEWRVEPRPAGASDGIDLDGNASANVWFEGLTETLAIESRAVGDDESCITAGRGC
jgi:hypothetical protein